MFFATDTSTRFRRAQPPVQHRFHGLSL